MSKTKNKDPANFGNAGVEVQVFGSANQFRRRILHPWTCTFKNEINVIELVSDLAEQVTVLESLSVDGTHHTTVIDYKDGTRFEITIRSKRIEVYPKTNCHQNASERLLRVIERNGGVLDGKV